MIPVSILRFRISADRPIYFGQNPGSKIRGALYQALRLIYDNEQEIHSRHAYNMNPVAWLMRLEDDTTSGGKNVPRPIAIRPPLVSAARRTSFAVAFFGSGHRCIPMVLSAVQAMQAIGLGATRQEFRLEGVDHIHPLTSRTLCLVDQEGKQLASLPDPPSDVEYLTRAEAFEQKITLRFLTPTQIVFNKRLTSKPDFLPLFQRLIERIQLISENYTSNRMIINFDEVLASAQAVKRIHQHIHWVTVSSHSKRTGKNLPVTGFTGLVTFSPVERALIPWLLVGQATQVGQNTSKGCGWYCLEEDFNIQRRNESLYTF